MNIAIRATKTSASSSPAIPAPQPGHRARHGRAGSASGQLISPQSLIQLIFDTAKGDKARAIANIIEAAKTNQTLRTHLIQRGASTVVGEVVRTDNSRIFTGNPNADVTKPRPAGQSRRGCVRAGLV